MFRVRPSALLLAAILTTVCASIASAQIVPVSQERWAWGRGDAEDLNGMADSSDGDTAVGNGPFVEGAGVTLYLQDALASGSATQNSTIGATSLIAYGSAAANAEAYDWDAYASAQGKARYHVVFDVSDTLTYTMTGNLAAYDNGDTYVTLSRGATTLLTLYAGFNEDTVVDTMGTLLPGQYDLLMHASAGAYADYSWQYDYGFASFDIDFDVAVSTGLPAPALEAPYLSVSPNPSRGKTVIAHHLPATSAAVIDVFDVSGRRVRSLVSGGSIVWDGRDDSGRILPAGVYFVRMSGEGTGLRKKVVLLR